MAGRPPIPFDQNIADFLCEELSTSNKATSTILAQLGKTGETVGVTTIYKWLGDNEQFAKDYARSKEEQADFLAEEMLEIADDDSLDVGFTDDGKPFVKGENIQRARLRVDTRKWIAAKLKPKKYGDKISQEITGKDGGPVETTSEVIMRPQVSREEWLAIHGLGTSGRTTTSGD